MEEKTINQEVETVALDELLKYVTSKGRRIKGIIEQGALAGEVYLSTAPTVTEATKAEAAKRLWICNYTLVELLTGQNMKVEFYTKNIKNDYYEFKYLDETFVKEILTFDKSSGFSIGNLENRRTYKKTNHSKKKGQVLANALFEATKGISKGARIAKNKGEEAFTDYARLLGLGKYKKDNDTIYPVQVNYSDSIEHYIYIKYSANEVKDGKKAVGQANNSQTKQQVYYFYYYAKDKGFDNAKYYNYGWLREHSLEVARNQSSANTKINVEKIRDTFTEKTENVPGYRIGDVNYSQIKYDNKHLMGIDTVGQLATMFKKLQGQKWTDVKEMRQKLKQSFYSSTATMQLDQMLNNMIDDNIDALINALK